MNGAGAGTRQVVSGPRGEIVGDYPYPFIDVPQIGYARALINSAGVLVLFAALAGAMLGAKALPARQR